MSIGVILWVIKMFLFFRGPSHMMRLYLYHPKTRSYAINALNASKGNIVKIAFAQLLVAMFLLPVFVIDFVLDIIVFTFFTEYKE